MRNTALSDTFSGIIIVAILIAGVLVGLQTYDGMETNEGVVIVDTIILITFCVEIVVKMLAEGLAPWRYFIGAGKGKERGKRKRGEGHVPQDS